MGNGNSSDGSQSPPMSPKPTSRSSRSSSPQPLFGFTPLSEANATTNATETQPNGSLPEFHKTVDLIHKEHHAAARELIRDPEILDELLGEIDRDCEWLRSFLFAAKVCLPTTLFPWFVI
jgi:aspartate kinase